MRILTVLAHPDDAEIWAGSALARHARDGAEVLICSLTSDLMSTRGQEAAAGAARLGARARLLGQEDRRLTPTTDAIASVSALLTEFEPTVVITHWEDDSHPDHVAANAITRAAIVGSEGNSGRIALLLACDTYLGMGVRGLFTPDISVDVGDVWEQKLAAIREHGSQNPEHYVAVIEHQCWLHGARAKVRYAEGFRRVPLYGRLGGAVRHFGPLSRQVQEGTNV